MNLIEYPTVRWARDLPDHPAIIVDGSVISYAELEARIVVCARLLRTHGVQTGDRVVLCAANSLEWVIIAHALPRIGAVLVPLSTRLLPDEIDRAEQILTPRLVIADSGRFSLWNDAVLIADFAQKNSEVDEAPIPAEVDSESLHTIVSTSGTGGEAKGVCLSFQNHLASALGSALNLGVDPNDRWLLNLPLHHIGGLSIILRAAVYGTAVVIHDRFDARAAWKAIDEDRVTQLSLVVTTLRRLLDALPDRYSPPHLRSVMVGGGPVPTSIIDEARDRSFPILPTYGMTETASQIATLSPYASDAKRHTAGHPLPLAEVVIIAEDGTPAAAGAEGRILVRGPMIAQGYWVGDESVEPLIGRDGWFATTDIGSFDDDGCLLVHGRIDNVIISGGEKIHAEEIESALCQHDTVTRAVVLGVPDDQWGERPTAFVELRPNCAYDPEELMEYLKLHLQPHKLPARIEVLSELPTLPTGKPDRAAIAAHANR